MKCPGAAITAQGVTDPPLRTGIDMPKGTPGRAPCTIDGCDALNEARGLCGRHYQRLMRHGDPHFTKLEPEIHDRFWTKVAKGDSDACWSWKAALDDDGYGKFTVNGKRRMAHRVVYEWEVGPIPAGYQVDHVCHNRDDTCAGGITCFHRRCVNPAHLEAVLPLVNMMRGKTPAARNAAKTHCPEGHPYEGRVCVICRRRRCREAYRRQARKKINV